jgi:serine/threonine protein kinase
VIDSSKLLEGNPFIITEYVEGSSVKDMLNRKGEFNTRRAVSIIRQVSYALSEVHQNGILLVRARDFKSVGFNANVSYIGFCRIFYFAFAIRW